MECVQCVIRQGVMAGAKSRETHEFTVYKAAGSCRTPQERHRTKLLGPCVAPAGSAVGQYA